MQTRNVLHIVGYKNSGKTTLVSKWVRILKNTGKKVAVIKHHGHGAKLAMPDAKKDSMQYLQAGADVSIVSGGGYTQNIIAQEKSYDDLLAQANLENPDIILVEGYKAIPAKKVVLIGKSEDWTTLQQLENIKLVIGLEEVLEYNQIDSRENDQALEAWILNWANELKG